MADYPESSIAKRYDLGTITVPTSAALSPAHGAATPSGANVVNLAKQALTIQGGLLGNFGGATVVGTVSTAITQGAGAGNAVVEIALQGSHDNSTWFTLSPAAASTSYSRFQVSATVANGTPSGALGQVASANFPGPLPQYIRGALISSTTNAALPNAGVVTLNVIVHG